MSQKISYFIKRNKLIYYIKNGFLDSLPRFIFRSYLKFWLREQNKYPKDIIENRVHYYCKIKEKQTLKNGRKIKTIRKESIRSMYYYDFISVARYFNAKFKVDLLFGDIDINLNEPTFVKSRPLDNNNNSVLLKLNKLRHFNFIDDSQKFKDKKNAIVWRGVIHKQNRSSLFEKCFGKTRFNIGAIPPIKNNPKWTKPFMTIKEQLDYKFIFSIEGNDVATNLKWIMSSNSLAFMPKPKFETWYMEGKLIPDFHYVLVKDDYSDVEEKMNYFIENSVEAERIIKNAKAWTYQFKDKKLEKIISILTINRYLEKTDQL